MDFQNQNMQAMNAAQQAKITKLDERVFRYSSGSWRSYKDKIYDIC
jgi:ABC-type enterochelin transport system substrate-binding protein